MRVIVEKPANDIDIVEMADGSLGVDSRGDVFYRTAVSAACLTNVGRSYSSIGDSRTPPDRVGHSVSILPSGTKVTLTV